MRSDSDLRTEHGTGSEEMSEDVQRSMHKDRRVAAVEWREGPISETRVCSDRCRRGSCLQVSEERGTCRALHEQGERD